jgi:crotonobetainyl-CoA:carnitine CoA-transferase CaiB-like acyl-CoA transferase
MGRPELAADPRFAAERDRRANQDELDALISAWTAELDKWEVFEQLQAAGVPCGPVLTAPEVFVDSHLRARGFFEPVWHRDAGAWEMERPLYRFTRRPTRIRMNAPAFAEHNDYVLRELIGLNADEVAQLEEQGVTARVPDMASHQ